MHRFRTHTFLGIMAAGVTAPAMTRAPSVSGQGRDSAKFECMVLMVATRLVWTAPIARFLFVIAPARRQTGDRSDILRAVLSAIARL